MRDIALNSTAYFSFCAYRFDTGAPADVASIVVSAYPDNSATQITAGITVTQPDSITGRYCVAVAATIANGYAPNTQYSLTITTGTVNSVSVVGTVVGEFSIRFGTPGLIATGIAQASAAGTIVLASATSFADDFLNGATVRIVSGTGAGQQRAIYDWTSATDTGLVSPDWASGGTPTTDSVYEVYATAPAGTAAASLPSVTVGTDGITAASIATGAIDADAIADNAIDAGAIASNAITAAKIASDAITDTKIAAGAITAAKFAANAITATVVADDTITAAKIAANAIGAAELADNAITANKIASDAITAAKIATGAIDADAIAADAVTEIQSGLATAAAVADLPTNAELATALGDLPTAAENAAATLAAAAAAPIESNIKEVNDVALQGDGTSGDKWRPA